MRVSAMIVLFSAILSISISAISAETDSSFWINPSYQHIFGPDFIPLHPPSLHSRSIPNTCTSYDQVVEAMRENMVHRKILFSFLMEYDFQFSQVGGILEEAYDDVITDDYLRLNIRYWSNGWSGYNGHVEVTYSVEYLTTYEQEQYVDQKVENELSLIITDTMNDEQKEKAIHDWIVLHVEYDLTYQEHSAYAALFLGQAVCQGYSLLAYKMLKEAGISSRIIESEAMNHAWNLVFLCGNWYHLDVTWDDPVNQSVDFIWYNYYNKSDDEFIQLNHQWDYSAYPEAPISYVEGVCENWPPPLPGDINKKDGINLQDAILALQVCSGVELPETVYSDAAINGDVIGIVEAIYALQTVAEIRR